MRTSQVGYGGNNDDVRLIPELFRSLPEWSEFADGTRLLSPWFYKVLQFSSLDVMEHGLRRGQVQEDGMVGSTRAYWFLRSRHPRLDL